MCLIQVNMRIVKKLGTDRYIEYDSESGRILTVEMTRNEYYSYRLKFQVDDLALAAIEAADREYEHEELQVSKL